MVVQKTESRINQLKLQKNKYLLKFFSIFLLFSETHIYFPFFIYVFL